MSASNPVHWTRMSERERARVEAAPVEYRGLLVELWAASRGEREASEARDDAERLGELAQVFRHGLDDDWPDGKRRRQLQTVMEDRAKNLREKYGCTLAELGERDAAAYRRFLEGCGRALLRDTLIAAGLLSKAELAKMKAEQLQREHDAKYADAAEDWRDGL